MTSCTHAEGHEFQDAVCIRCGTEDGLGRAPLFAGLRAIQELHSSREFLHFPGELYCTHCETVDGEVPWPCKTRQLADKALGEKSNDQ